MEDEGMLRSEEWKRDMVFRRMSNVAVDGVPAGIPEVLVPVKLEETTAPIVHGPLKLHMPAQAGGEVQGSHQQLQVDADMPKRMGSRDKSATRVLQQAMQDHQSVCSVEETGWCFGCLDIALDLSTHAENCVNARCSFPSCQAVKRWKRRAPRCTK